MFDKQEVIKTRRQIHSFPEIGWGEFYTTYTIVKKLEELKCFEILLGKQIINESCVLGRVQSVVDESIKRAKEKGIEQSYLDRMDGYTGCVAIFDSGKEGKTIILRYDIDCVNVEETDNPYHIPNKEGFASQNPGLMHACGHDTHATTGITVAKWISQNKDKLKGKIKIIFQPAEEGVRGASAIAGSGIADDGDYFICSHIGMGIPSGEIVTSPYNFLSTTKIDISFSGKPAHAGMEPHAGNNALLAAAYCATQLHSISRHGEGASRINVGVLKAGEGRNVVPCTGLLQLEVRGENAKINEYMKNRVLEIAKGVSLAWNVEHKITIMGEAVDMQCDIELVELLEEIAAKTEGIKNIERGFNFNGSEDATIFARKVQANGGKALYFGLGSNIKAGHHQKEFDINEEDIFTGIRLHIKLIEKLAGA